MEETINKSLIERTLEFHGLPLIKTWNDEQGVNSLNNIGIQPNLLDTSLYFSRMKNLSYTDRTKRMRLHHFICSKSAQLFQNVRQDPSDKRLKKLIATGDESIPPLEFFSTINKDERVNKFFSNIKPGDIAYGIVAQVTKFGIAVKILCTVGSHTFLVSDLNLKGTVAQQNLIPALDSKNVSRQFLANDYVCCEVLSIGDQFPQLNLGMLSEHERYDNGPSLGLISFHQMPQFYKIAIEQRSQDKSYNQILRESETFNNPSIVENLLIQSDLHPNHYYSFMSRNKFPQDEYAKDLRQQQASKLAFRSVAEGIAHFKEGRHTEAFQCLNKALSIDQRNVEGLVARGALYANSGSFTKAIVDFEAALKINPNHANAKKYLGETLLALGRSYEEDNKFEEAQKAYIDCLNINPHHQEALASLNYIKAKLNARKIVEPAELELPPLNIGSIPSLKVIETKRDYHDGKIKDETRSKKSKKDKKKKGKKRQSSSSESSSESSDSSESSSVSSENSSSSSDSDSNSRSKKKDKKRKSLSPISKRLDAAPDSSYHYNQSFEIDDHELKVKKFLEMGKDEDDYEEKVGQLIAEASKYQRSKQAEEAKQAKKKKKSDKKLKKDKKKRKKDDKKKSKGNEIEDLREALKMFENLPEKIKKLYQEKMREEEAAKKDAPAGEEGKWKMKFSKDERQGDAKKQSKNFSLYESDEEDQTRNFQSHPQTQSGFSGGASTSGTNYNDKKRSPVKLEVAPIPALNPISKGPVVLDKFGNFRLAEIPQTIQKPAETTTSARRSRSRSRRSRSRSDSRSPRRRRSGSGYRRRYSRSRSYSRSYSRSPTSRSRGGGRGFGRFDNRSRQRYSPRGGGGRGGSIRGRWNDNFRDSRDYRRGNDRFDRDRRGGGMRGGPRFNRFDNRRSFSRSPVRSDRSPKASPDRRDNSDRKDRWADDSLADERKDDKDMKKTW